VGLKGKPYALFYTHGGGGRVRDSLSIFARVGTLVGNPIESYGKPTSEVLEKCKALGTKLASAV
jgi:flavorubredoxin